MPYASQSQILLPGNLNYFGASDEPASKVVQRYDLSQRWRQPYQDRWAGFYRLYRFYRDEETNPYKSNIFIPYLFSLVESAVPKMVMSVFAANPIITVSERPGGRRNLAKLIERVLDYIMDEDTLELPSRFTDFCKEMAIYGTGVLKIIPSFKRRLFIGDDEDYEFSHVDMVPCDLWNVFPDYRAPSPERAKYIIHRGYMDLDDVEEMAKMGLFNKKAVEECKNSMLLGPEMVDWAKKQRLDLINIAEAYGVDPWRGIIEVLEYWDGKDKIMVGGRQATLQHIPNEFGVLPYLFARYCQVPHELFGLGIPEMGEGLQEELNVLRSLRMDNLQLIINRIFIASKLAGIDPANLLSYPGNVIWANDVKAVEPLQQQDISRSAYDEEQILKNDLQNVTGEWEHARGAMPEHKETATGIVRLQDATMARFNSITITIKYLLKKMVKLSLLYVRQYMPPERFAQIVGPEDFQAMGGQEFYTMPLEDLWRCYQFEPDPAALSGNSDAKLAQTMQVFQMFNGDPLFDPIVLREMVLDALQIKNKRELLAPAYELVEKYGIQPNALLFPPGGGGPMLGALGNGGPAGAMSGGMSELAGQARNKTPQEVSNGPTNQNNARPPKSSPRGGTSGNRQGTTLNPFMQ